MGLLKTGLTLAAGYSLVKATSKAVNTYEDKKQRRSNQSQTQFQQQHYSDYESQRNQMQGKQMCCHSSQLKYHQGNDNTHNVSQVIQPRHIQDSSKGYEHPLNQSPPPYYQAGGQVGSAQDYYSGKKL